MLTAYRPAPALAKIAPGKSSQFQASLHSGKTLISGAVLARYDQGLETESILTDGGLSTRLLLTLDGEDAIQSYINNLAEENRELGRKSV